jgi:hypothetical protein
MMRFSFFQRMFVLALVAGIFGLTVAEAQPRRLNRPSVPDVREIDQEEGKVLIDHLQRQRLATDFSFLFDLAHLPHRDREMNFRGILWGTWNERGGLTRMSLQPVGATRRSDPPDGVVRLLVQNGFYPEAWIHDTEAGLAPLSLDQWTTPLRDPLIFTPFDLIMPFIFWDEFYYQGSTRVRGRPVHQFMFFPPEDFASENPGVGAVRASLDARFNALLQVEVIDAEERVLRSLNVLNFRRVDDQWIVRTIELIDRTTRHRARFEVFGVAFPDDLPWEWFQPESLRESGNPVETDQFNYF